MGNIGSQYTLSTRYLVSSWGGGGSGRVHESLDEVLVLVNWLRLGEEVCIYVLALAVCYSKCAEADFVPGPVVFHLHRLGASELTTVCGYSLCSCVIGP